MPPYTVYSERAGVLRTIFIKWGGLSNIDFVSHKKKWGRHGFDMGRETFGACRGVEFLLKPATQVIVANDDNYALAA